MQQDSVEQRFSQIWEPLFHVEPANQLIIDSLHMQMRVQERLLKNLFKGTIHMDNLKSRKEQEAGPMFLALQTAVQDIIGPAFHASVDELGEISLTTLWGSHQEKLLDQLVPKFEFASYIQPSIREHVVRLWSTFAKMRNIFASNAPTQKEIDSYYSLAIQFQQDFFFIGSKTSQPGYQRQGLPIYFHLLVIQAK